jgi:hypothetical protein
MYSNFFNENVHWSVSYDFSKFDGSRKSKCDDPSDTTQRQDYLISLLQFPFVRNFFKKCIVSNHLNFREMPSIISMG